MRTAIVSAITGVGVTLASTFASSLGLSLHQQRIVVAFGVALIFLGVVLFFRQNRTSSPAPQPAASVRSNDQKGGIPAGSIGSIHVALPDRSTAEGRVQQLINDSRYHAKELRGFIEDMRRRESQVQDNDGSLREGYKRWFATRELDKRSRELYLAGREWGFFQPIEESHFGMFFNKVDLCVSADRLLEFADYLEERQS